MPGSTGKASTRAREEVSMLNFGNSALDGIGDSKNYDVLGSENRLGGVYVKTLRVHGDLPALNA